MTKRLIWNADLEGLSEKTKRGVTALQFPTDWAVEQLENAEANRESGPLKPGNLIKSSTQQVTKFFDQK